MSGTGVDTKPLAYGRVEPRASDGLRHQGRSGRSGRGRGGATKNSWLVEGKRKGRVNDFLWKEGRERKVKCFFCWWKGKDVCVDVFVCLCVCA